MCNHPYGFEIYLVNVKTMRTIAQIFVVFSEKLNFKRGKTDVVNTVAVHFRATALMETQHFFSKGQKAKCGS